MAALSQFRSPEVYSIHSHQEAAVVKIRVHFGVGQYIFPESGMLNSYGRKGNLQARQRRSPESTVGVDRVKDYSTELGWDLKKKKKPVILRSQICASFTWGLVLSALSGIPLLFPT